MPTRPTVLIVEDEVAMQEALYEALRLDGYPTVIAASVEEAEAIRQRLGPEALGLVIADIKLSRKSGDQEGYALFQRWTTAHPTLPFVLISAAVSSRTLPAVRTGTVRFLPKPFDLDELFDALRTFLKTERTRTDCSPP